MSAGEFLAGEMDLAGEEPSAERMPPRDARLPRALVFDGRTRTFLLGDDGRYLDGHPVDQEVALALLIEFGSITSAPSTGTTIRRVQYLSGAKVLAEVSDRVRRSLARPLRDGDIQELSLSVTNPSPWALTVVYEYINVRAGDEQRRRIEVPASQP